jgi:Zn-dependent metalloprotease
LNEHISDCFAIMIKHRHHSHRAETGNWDISPGNYSASTMDYKKWTENYCRTFKIPADPEKSPDQTAKVWPTGFKFTGQTEVHKNCGIGNHAFYLAAMEFKGNTWEKLGQIWYDALTDPEFAKGANQTYKGWKALTIKHAKDADKQVLERAWEKVGV